MVEILKRTKALSVRPLKSSPTIGAALAFLGMDRAIPMLHGAQGCTAFAKVVLIQHFSDPIPMQTTAIDHTSAVMGADENVVEGLARVCVDAEPALIGLPTTGLTETEGADIQRTVREFRARYPQHADVAVVPVSTPDYVGSMESGFAAATKAMIDVLVPESDCSGRRANTVNLLAGPSLTPGDIEELRDLIAGFGLHAIVLPDLSGSLDGHLAPCDHSLVTTGGTRLEDVRAMGEAAATLVIGSALYGAAELLATKTGVPEYRFAHAMGLRGTDAIVAALSEISGRPVPSQVRRHRARLQDAMMDSHFLLGTAPVGISGDPEMLMAFGDLLASVGAELAVVVASDFSPVLRTLPADRVKIGDLEDFEAMAAVSRPAVLIGNSHLVSTAEELDIPLLRAGFPLSDILGGQQRVWVGYRGGCQTLFDLSNLVLARHHGPAPYRSVFSSPDLPGDSHGQAIETRGRPH